MAEAAASYEVCCVQFSKLSSFVGDYPIQTLQVAIAAASGMQWVKTWHRRLWHNEDIDKCQVCQFLVNLVCCYRTPLLPRWQM